MGFIILIIKGFIVGLALVIPGLSGGTIAIYLGIYDKLIHSLGKIFKDFKSSFAFLFPLMLGVGIAIVSLAKLLGFLLDQNSFLVLMFFIGLLLGGMPHLFLKIGAKPFFYRFILLGLIGFLIVVLMHVFADKTNIRQSEFPMTIGFFFLIILFGIVSSITMIIPGISGSALLMTLGVYYAIVTNVIGNIFDFSQIKYHLFVILPFGMGIALGTILFSNVLEKILKNHPRDFFSAIIGFILGSVVAIFLEIKDPKTGLTFNEQRPIIEDFFGFIKGNVLSFSFGFVLLIAGFLGVYFLMKKQNKPLELVDEFND